MRWVYRWAKERLDVNFVLRIWLALKEFEGGYLGWQEEVG